MNYKIIFLTVRVPISCFPDAQWYPPIELSCWTDEQRCGLKESFRIVLRCACLSYVPVISPCSCQKFCPCQNSSQNLWLRNHRKISICGGCWIPNVLVTTHVTNIKIPPSAVTSITFWRIKLMTKCTFLSPTSENGHQHYVTNKTISPKSLSPLCTFFEKLLQFKSWTWRFRSPDFGCQAPYRHIFPNFGTLKMVNIG